MLIKKLPFFGPKEPAQIDKPNAEEKPKALAFGFFESTPVKKIAGIQIGIGIESEIGRKSINYWF